MNPNFSILISRKLAVLGKKGYKEIKFLTQLILNDFFELDIY